MNTLLPYTEGAYCDARPLVRVAEDEVLPINETLGFNPDASRLKELDDARERGGRAGDRLAPLQPLTLPWHRYLAHP